MGLLETLIIVIPLAGQLINSIIRNIRDEKKSNWEKMADIAATAWQRTTEASSRIPELSGNAKVQRALDLWRALIELRPDTKDKPTKDDLAKAEQFFRALEFEERAGGHAVDAAELERLVEDAKASKRPTVTAPLPLPLPSRK
ncbi:MAG TPA: hypothetical protein VK510_03110 [Solirubrobacteraceae bacterium]|nr:hypothetical protein [Solirubrobacteraceae bacterium]